MRKLGTNHLFFDRFGLVRTITNAILWLAVNDCTLIIVLCFIEYMSQIIDMLSRVAAVYLNGLNLEFYGLETSISLK